MTGFYWLRPDRASRHTGDTSATHKWALPGLRCPDCGASWAGGMAAYPGVNLDAHPEKASFEMQRPEPFDEFMRLRELIRPLVPPGAPLLPGTGLGPLVGTARGSFGPFFFQDAWTLLVHEEVLRRLQAEGVRGLRGFPTELRFRQKQAPVLLELELDPHGRLHPDCTPPRPPPCPRCGRDAFTRPERLVLDAASLPADTDVFRLADFETTLIATQRFKDAVERRELGEVVFQEISLR
ncbi:double-CXXCG motif protein [Myxococcaceae bacterium GXIMD 01537]